MVLNTFTDNFEDSVRLISPRRKKNIATPFRANAGNAFRRILDILFGSPIFPSPHLCQSRLIRTDYNGVITVGTISVVVPISFDRESNYLLELWLGFRVHRLLGIDDCARVTIHRREPFLTPWLAQRYLGKVPKLEQRIHN